MLRTLYKLPIVLLLISLPVIAQTSQEPASEASKTGSITGRVVDQSGQPLPNARVSVMPVQGGRPSGNTNTDREGSFKVTGLDPVPYRVYVDLPAYLRTPDEPGNVPPGGRQYKVGDSVKFVFFKGGVITGTVTNANGDPVIGIRVRARMTRNDKDQKQTTNTFYRESATDDRGVYRIYGLPTGTYIVATGGEGEYSHGPLGAFDSFLPTYAPSGSTRDSAVEISVRAGEETNNIDIAFRGEMGRTVSGSITGSGIEGSFNVSLTTVAPAGSQTNVSRHIQPGSSQFTFNGVADGDYYLTAHSYSQNRELAITEPKLIRVRGADLEDLELTFTTLGSVSGRVMLEESKVAECQGKQPPEFKDTFMAAWHRDTEAARNLPQFIWSMGVPVSADSQGNFTIRNLAASQYYFVARFPARSWFLKSIAMNTRDRKPSNVTRVWTTIKSGDKLSGLIVTLAQGGALFQGQIEGETIPEKLSVYLIPSEREAADELLGQRILERARRIPDGHQPPRGVCDAHGSHGSREAIAAG